MMLRTSLVLLAGLLPAHGSCAGAQVFRDPFAMMRSHREPRVPTNSVVTFSAIGALPTADRSLCPTTTQSVKHRSGLDSGWLRLAIAMPAELEEAVSEWLQRDSMFHTHERLTHQQHLERLFAGYAAALAAMVPSQKRPEHLQYTMVLVTGPCEHTEKVVTHEDEARARLEFPLVFDAQSVLQPSYGGTATWRLAQVVAHESAHVLQFHPFDLHTWLQRTRLPGNGVQADGPYHTQVEMEAVLVERCLRLPVLALDNNDESRGRIWRDQRRLFGLAFRGDRAVQTMFDRYFRTLSAIVGSGAFGTPSPAQLRTMFAHCAMVLNEPGTFGKRSPTRAEQDAGDRALAAAQAIGPPQYQYAVIYDDMHITAAEVYRLTGKAVRPVSKSRRR